jgi:hypothetical protein
VALNIVPASPRIDQGKLDRFSVVNLQRRIKAVLDRLEVEAAIGGLDVSFNEDSDGKYAPLWSVHAYVITGTKDRKALGRTLRKTCKCSLEVPRPTKVVGFENTARRRSYALKTHFKRRVGHVEERLREAKPYKVRNTQNQRLRAVERLELWLFLDRIGLASRVFFRMCEPRSSLSRVSIEPRGRPYRADGAKRDV